MIDTTIVSYSIPWHIRLILCSSLAYPSSCSCLLPLMLKSSYPFQDTLRSRMPVGPKELRRGKQDPVYGTAVNYRHLVHDVRCHRAV